MICSALCTICGAVSEALIFRLFILSAQPMDSRLSRPAAVASMVPTPEGAVMLTIPKGTSSGRIFRLKGKGVHNATTRTTGDQLVSVRIVLPTTIDDKLAYFLSEWRQTHKYDPGRSH